MKVRIWPRWNARFVHMHTVEVSDPQARKVGIQVTQHVSCSCKKKKKRKLKRMLSHELKQGN